ESGVEGVSRDLPRVIDANWQGEISPSWHIKPSDGSVGGAPEAVRQSVLTEVLPHDRAREIDSLGVGSFEGTVRRGGGGGAGGRHIEGRDGARCAAHETVNHAVRVDVLPGNFAQVIDALGEGPLEGVSVRAGARNVKHHVLALRRAHESMNRTGRQIRAADPVVARDRSRVIDGRGSRYLGHHRAW